MLRRLLFENGKESARSTKAHQSMCKMQDYLFIKVGYSSIALSGVGKGLTEAL